MYKTISVNLSTYQRLSAIATRFAKPKAQVLDEIIKSYAQSMAVAENAKLDQFNQFVQASAKKINFPKGTKIDTEDLDKSFSVLVK
jgi:predicted DNA-binding protein